MKSVFILLVITFVKTFAGDELILLPPIDTVYHPVSMQIFKDSLSPTIITLNFSDKRSVSWDSATGISTEKDSAISFQEAIEMVEMLTDQLNKSYAMTNALRDSIYSISQKAGCPSFGRCEFYCYTKQRKRK